jgi:hypothetical protein
MAKLPGTSHQPESNTRRIHRHGAPGPDRGQSTNVGFSAPINQGLVLAKGEDLVLVNNDVVVTDRWLDQLAALANAESRTTAETWKNGENHRENGFTAKGAKIAKEDEDGGVGSGFTDTSR